MNLKRLAITSAAIIVAIAILTIASARISHAFPPPSNDHNSATYYDPRNDFPAILYQNQQRSSDADTNGFHCLAILDPPRTSATGWPFAYLFTVDYGCPGSYRTFAPFALAADLVIFLLVSVMVVFGISRLRSSRK